jgi:hypothetical protein
VTNSTFCGIVRLSLEVTNRAGQRVSGLKALRFPGTVGQIETLDWQGEVLLPPGHVVNANALLTAALASTGTFDILGFTVPLGTLQLP